MGNAKEAIILFLLGRIAYIDCKKRVIPREYLLIGCEIRLFLLIIEVFQNGHGALNQVVLELAGSIIIMVFLFGVRCLSHMGLGMGDVKLLGVISLFLGWTVTIEALGNSMIIAVVLGCFSYIKNKAKEIPFAPALLCGTILTIFSKNSIFPF